MGHACVKLVKSLTNENILESTSLHVPKNDAI